VAAEAGKHWSYSWAPDSDRIAYAGFHGGQWQLYWVSRTSGEVRRLTSIEASNGFVRYPAWSADGRTIVFERTSTGGNIFLGELVH
jgi:Tol biopolymer transport system component